MTNITTNLGSHFFGFFHGDLKIFAAKIQKEKLKERQILQRRSYLQMLNIPSGLL